MARTLKERYEAKRILLVQERVKKADAQLLYEQRSATLIVEAMDENDLNKVAAIIKKLDTIKDPQLPKLTAAIEQAEAEINKYTAGGPLTAAWTKMKKLVGIDNPVVKVTTFADALEKGFSQIPKILKNNGVDLEKADLKKSLVNFLTGLGSPAQKTGQKTDKELGDTNYSGNNKTFTDDPVGSEFPGPSQNEADNANKGADIKLKNITSQLQKALSPGGIFGAFKKVPYISSADLAQELIKVPLNVFSAVAEKINSGDKAAELAPGLKDKITAAGATQTKGVDPVEPAQHTGQSQPTQSTKQTTATTGPTPTGQSTPAPNKAGGAPVDYGKAKSKLEPLFKSLRGKTPDVDTVVKKLVDAGLDVDKF